MKITLLIPFDWCQYPIMETLLPIMTQLRFDRFRHTMYRKRLFEHSKHIYKKGKRFVSITGISQQLSIALVSFPDIILGCQE